MKAKLFNSRSCEFSLKGLLEDLSGPDSAKDWREDNLEYLNLYCEKLLPLILPEQRKKHILFSSIEGLGGEAVVIKAFDNICHRDTIFKVAFPGANMAGKKSTYRDAPNKTRVEYFNVIRERFVRGGAQIAGALSDYINRKYGIIPQIRGASVKPVYIEMEYLQGEFPIGYFREKDFPEKFDFFYRLLVFVGIVHGLKIIHRDIKPSNILVIDTEDGSIPAILDWTFAKQMNFDSEEEDVYFDLTQQSNMNFHIHSPCFSSPRLISGGGLDADYQDDIYSLGQLMYCLFTGDLPREIKDFNKRKEQIKLGSKVLPASPLCPELLDIYIKSTHVNEEFRYKTINEFIVDLETFAGKININTPIINVPEIISPTEELEEFIGITESKNETKEEIVSELVGKTLVISVSNVNCITVDLLKNLVFLMKNIKNYENVEFVERT